MADADFVFTPPPRAVAQVADGGMFPVRRIFCVGRNYAGHVQEMGGDPKARAPVFFTKPADALVASGASLPYPSATANLHYEGELVAALKAGGANIPADAAGACVFGYAAGCDLTRRDLQGEAKAAGAPWDAAKAFDRSAPLGPIARAEGRVMDRGRIALSVNGEERQASDLSNMIWRVDEIVAALSAQFELAAGDLIFTGTPEGVGPLVRGDQVTVAIEGLPALSFSIS